MSGTKPTDGQRSVFHYPLVYRIAAGVGTLFLGTSTVLAAGVGHGMGGGVRWPAVFFGACAALNAWFLWTLLPRIETDAEGMTLQRLGLKRRLRWRDVRAVEHRPASSSLIVRGPSGALRIHRQLQQFLVFYNRLKAAVPSEALGRPLQLPFTVAGSRTLLFSFGGAFLFFAFLGGAGLFWEGLRLPLMLLGLAALCLLAVLRYVPRRFHFDRDGLQVVYLARKAKYRAEDLIGIELIQRSAVILLRMKFRRGTVDLKDSQILIAPERLYESLIEAYPVAKG
jgi:membrane protein implicated in regulation of membrane protease activity